ncbi:MAG: UDP-glucose 4-epimerase GalE [Planctomycetes bacterium]|nr:UDP-glucose 4-epimerase GalE [Planctomycetota bacterium]
MNVLLTGGAGYIGSHVLRALKSAGHECVVYDSLVKGHRRAAGKKLVVGDVADGQALRKALAENKIEAVIHLAAFIEAGESVVEPDKYFRNNTMIGLTLLEAMRDCGIKKMVFSSTAAVYGTPARVPIEEDDRLAPINPYGASKLCVEYMLSAYAAAYGLGIVSLRYFNVAGAHPTGEIGEDHQPETHLIPLVLQVPMGKRPGIKIFGDDYETPDGTCIRDYIHVCDLADAHVLAIGAVKAGQVKVFNLGNGEGFSVKQVIETCRKATGHPIPAEAAPRRPGDPARLIASSKRAMSELDWKPKFPDLPTIVQHAWQWHQKNPNGYGDK